MQKIYPIYNKPYAWKNYSNYINWTYEKIEALKDYLFYFSPNYSLVNETMLILDVVSLREERTISLNKFPEWEYQIVKDDDENDYRIVYCYFPSELHFRQGYINTHAEAYLCYFVPPDALVEKRTYNNFEEKPKIRITETDWNEKITSGDIVKFPISRIIMSHKWRHSGVQHSANEDGFNKENYIIIAKPTACWYVAEGGKNKLSFTYFSNAMESVGAFVPLALEFSPVRYVLNDQESKWGARAKTKSIYAAIWDNAYTMDALLNIYTPSKVLWTNSYPVMHSLQIRSSTKENNVVKYSCEDFIGDDIFSIEKVNMNNHTTSVYNIPTANSFSEISGVWEDSVFITIC